VLNCPDGAFDNAIATLEARAKAWGPQSVDLLEWLRGQDQVFSNCTNPGGMPQGAPSNASDLLKWDRAYQIAAAHFYAGQYDDAIAGFEAIGRDKASPWSRWGEYLAARAEIRKAATVAPTVDWGGQAAFDPELMKSAQQRLQRIIDTNGDAQMRHAAEAELAFVNVRLDPEKRLNAISMALAGPGTDAEFDQHLKDLLFLTGHGVQGDTDLLQWIETDSSNDALANWKAERSLPWLVSALAIVPPGTPEASELMAAAAKIPADSPGYLTVNYYRAQLALRQGQQAEARKLLSSLLAGLSKDEVASTRNALLALRMRTAEFLMDTPRTAVTTNSQASSNATCGYKADGTRQQGGCYTEIPAQQFDADAVTSFNLHVPLSLWVKAADGSAEAEARKMPLHLRQAIAWAAWVRAIGLDDAAAAKQLAPMLPPALRDTAGDSIGFPATLAMLRSPGLQPYLIQGTPRSLSFSKLDDYRDNWWCAAWGDGQILSNGSTAQPAMVAQIREQSALHFLTAEEQKTADDEHNRLNALPGGVIWLGRRAIDYVKAHPGDKDGAEALALTVRATRYGCSLTDEAQRKQISKEAFDMLHRLCPKSVWADKTRYYY
jgi:tetratricopeptide (TPR) repeat protein